MENKLQCQRSSFVHNYVCKLNWPPIFRVKTNRITSVFSKNHFYPRYFRKFTSTKSLFLSKINFEWGEAYIRKNWTLNCQCNEQKIWERSIFILLFHYAEKDWRVLLNWLLLQTGKLYGRNSIVFFRKNYSFNSNKYNIIRLMLYFYFKYKYLSNNDK